MKKSKIIISVFSVIIGVIGITAIFFPSLPVYYKLKKECPSIDKPLENFTYNEDIPENFTEITAGGITLKVPSDMYRKNPESSVEIYVCGEEKNYNTVVMFHKPSDVSEYDSSALSYDELESICKYLNKDVPQSLYELQKLNLNLSSDDFSFRNIELAERFCRLAVSKELLAGQDRCSHIYSFENNDTEGLIYEYETSRNDTEYNASIYQKEKYNIEYGVIVRAKNPETARQILKSIKITEE